MTFHSTRASPGLRKPGQGFTFQEAVFLGLAPDGGLFHPAGPENLSDLFESLPSTTAFPELAAGLTHRLLKPEIPPQTAQRITAKAFPFSPRLRKIDDSLYILELYHGPSYAFKDFGAGFLACCMEEFLAQNRRTAVVLVATSGDTGSAVARAFYRKENIQVVILYPSGRVSPLQEKQLTVLGENITTLEVKGSFDDCQRMVKDAFMDRELRDKIPLTSANSINLGRLIPQAFYYIYAYLRLRRVLREGWRFCVPSGNFGNLTAGVYAWQWGMPAKGFIAATNINDVVPEYLGSGVFTPRASHQTLSNAMDVGNPSNFERLLSVFENDWPAMRQVIHGEVVTDRDTLKTMEEVEREHGIFLCPHTAVGYLASRRFLEQNSADGSQVVLLATAHPAKFPETVKRATGREPDLPAGLREALELPKRSIPVDSTLEAFREILLDRFQ